MQQREVEIVNKLGLHARASAKLTQLASRFQADVWMSNNSRRVNAKSIMGVMMLAMDELVALVADRFGEES
jgi:phosphocarrier protein